MSDHDSNIEFLSTTAKNPRNTQENRLFITPFKSNTSSLLSSSKLPIGFDLLNLDSSFFLRKIQSKSSVQLYSSSQNVNQQNIISSS